MVQQEHREKPQRGAGQQGSVAASSLLGMTLQAGDDLDLLSQLVARAAYFSLFSLPNPASPSTAIPLIPALPALPLAIGFDVHEDLHRFDVQQSAPTANCGFRVRQSRGQAQVASVSMQMTPTPNNFQAAPGRQPPPTILLPFLSQRFVPLNGSFQFKDANQSGFSAFGAGRTLPTSVAGQQQTLLGAAIDTGQGSGSLKGLCGTGTIIGDIEPPAGFAFNVLFRFVDPDGSLEAQAALPPLQGPSNPSPDTVFMPFLSEPDPEHPLQARLTADGKRAQVSLFERLRLVETGFDVGQPQGLRCKTTAGAVVGRHSTTLVLDLDVPGQVIPAYSKEGEFSFSDSQGKSIGGFKANLLEGRLFPTCLPGLQTPILRIGGFAPPTSGTGQFKDPVGMVAVNGAFSLASGAVSTLYMVRLSDPAGVFQAASEDGEIAARTGGL